MVLAAAAAATGTGTTQSTTANIIMIRTHLVGMLTVVNNLVLHTLNNVLV